MSRYMQLTVRIKPYYKKGLKEVYPGLAGNLSYLNKVLVEEGPSLFEIVRRLDKLLYDLEGNSPFKEILLKHRDKLRKLHKEIQAFIADWDLAKADQALYKIEDIFDEIEWELDKV